MQIQVTVTFEPLDDGKYSEQELREAICEQFRTGGELWLTMKDGMEIAVIAQDAK